MTLIIDLEGRRIVGKVLAQLVSEQVKSADEPAYCVRNAAVLGDLALPRELDGRSITLEECSVGGSLSVVAEAPRSLSLKQVWVLGTVIIQVERLEMLYVSGCVVSNGLFFDSRGANRWRMENSTVYARGVPVAIGAQQLAAGSVSFVGCRFEGRVDLARAVLTTSLSLQNCKLHSSEGDALTAEGLRAGGIVGISVTHSIGSVRLSSLAADAVQIDGEFYGGPDDWALHLQNMRIVNGLNTGPRFATRGRIDVSGAAFGGSVEFEGARLDGRGRHALSLQSTTIKGNLFMRNDFKSFGALNLSNAVVEGNLEIGNAVCRGSAYDPASHDSPTVAVSARGLSARKIGLGPGSTFVGAVDLTDSRSEEIAIHSSSMFTTGEAPIEALRLAGCTATSVSIRGETTILGAVDISRLEVGSAWFESVELRARPGSKLALRAEGMAADQFVWSPTRVVGTVLLGGARVRYLYDESTSWDHEYNLDGFEFDRVGERVSGDRPVDARIEWLRSKRREDDSWSPWRSLAHALHEGGSERDARRVMISAHDEASRWFVQLLLGRTTGYGYRLSNVSWLLVVVALTAFGVVVVGAASFEHANQPLSDATSQTVAGPEMTVVEAALVALDTAVPIVGVPEAGQWLPDRDRAGLTVSLVLGVLRVASFVLASVGLAAVTLYGRPWRE